MDIGHTEWLVLMSEERDKVKKMCVQMGNSKCKMKSIFWLQKIVTHLQEGDIFVMWALTNGCSCMVLDWTFIYFFLFIIYSRRDLHHFMNHVNMGIWLSFPFGNLSYQLLGVLSTQSFTSIFWGFLALNLLLPLHVTLFFIFIL